MLLCDNVCAAISIRLMWMHLKESNRAGNAQLPVHRYYKVVAWIAFHALIDVFALIVYGVSQIGTSYSFSPQVKNFLGYFSTTMFAYHVAFYPVVYVLVRDLKFHEQLKQLRGSSVSPAKLAVKKLFWKSKPSSPNSPTFPIAKQSMSS